MGWFLMNCNEVKTNIYRQWNYNFVWIANNSIDSTRVHKCRIFWIFFSFYILFWFLFCCGYGVWYLLLVFRIECFGYSCVFPFYGDVFFLTTSQTLRSDMWTFHRHFWMQYFLDASKWITFVSDYGNGPSPFVNYFCLCHSMHSFIM